MPGPIATDTPDYQRGVFNPQALLAEVPAGVASITVGIPANAETILITASGTPARPSVIVEGVGTLYKYAGVSLASNNWITSAPTWAFDVSSTVDQQVTVTLSLTPTEPWYIYADAAPRVTFDATVWTSQQGMQYIIPCAPNFLGSDHPPNELQVASGIFGATGLVINYAAVGQRYRLFATQIGSQGQAYTGYLTDTVSGEILAIGGQGNGGALALPVTGYPMSAHAGLQFNSWGGTGNMAVVVYYTTEEL